MHEWTAFRWTAYPMVRVAGWFIGGTLLGIYLPDVMPEAYALSLLPVLAFFFLLARYAKWKVAAGMAGLSVVLMAAYLRVLAVTESRQADHFMYAGPVTAYEAVITRFAEERAQSWRCEAKVTRVQADAGWKSVRGKVLLYFPKREFSTPFSYGDQFLIRGAPQAFGPPANPGEFDYRKFRSYRKIYHQHFISSHQLHQLGNAPPNFFLAAAFRARAWASQTLDMHVTGDRERAIASALVLGVTDGLDNELLNAYSATGAMHVLAVSGLHVGILYGLLLLFMRPVKDKPQAKWWVAAVSLLVLWAYAFITGLSPSVLRAVTMFTFVALARPWQQRTNIYNTLAAAAFCLLVFDPYLAMSVGFQLSFIAVLGIVYLQPIFLRLWSPANRLVHEVWKITCVSLAAQVATFTLGLLYFHQFPNYFLFSNLLVIPLSFVILIGGLAVVAASPLGWAASATGFLLTWAIKAMNAVVFAVEGLPFSLLNDIYITTFQCWLLMAIIFLLLCLWEFKQLSFLYAAIGLALLFSGLQWQRFFQDIYHQKLTVYQVRGHTAIDFVQNGKAWFVTDSALLHDQGRVRFHIRPNRLRAGVTHVQTNDIPFCREAGGVQVFKWANKTIVRCTQSPGRWPARIAADVLIISNNVFPDLHRCAVSAATTIVIDSSNTPWKSKFFLEQAAAHGLTVHSVLAEGAFEIHESNFDI